MPSTQEIDNQKEDDILAQSAASPTGTESPLRSRRSPHESVASRPVRSVTDKYLIVNYRKFSPSTLDSETGSGLRRRPEKLSPIGYTRLVNFISNLTPSSYSLFAIDDKMTAKTT